MNLLWLLAIPLVTLVLLLFNKKLEQARMIALMGSVAQLIAGAWLLFAYYQLPAEARTGSLVFLQSLQWFPSLNINLQMGVDGISIAMILLTAFVVVAGVLVSWKIEKMPREFFFLLTLLGMGAYGFFISTNIFLIFLFLEIAVIPKYLLIGIWGSGKKIYSANKLVLMLMGASALIFVGLLGLWLHANANGISFDLQSLVTNPMNYKQQLFFFPMVFIGFGAFTALFPFHTWVPDGHSSAPTAGSMFLAGISMKLGGYGCLRVATYLMPQAAEYYSSAIIVLAAIAIIYGAFVTMMQTDLKYINAYSSVSHCGFVLLGIGMLTKTAIAGAVVQMVSHGLMTALFFAVIGMIYERTHTRDVSKMGGLLKSIPFISTLFFLAGLTSLGLPGLSGFVAEMMVFVGAWERPDMLSRVATIASVASIVVTAVYILRLIGKVILGDVPEAYANIKEGRWYEKWAAGLLMAGIVIIGVLPFLIIELVNPGVNEIMNQLSAIAK